MREIKFRALPDKNYNQMSGWYYGVDGLGKDNIFPMEMFNRHLRAGRLDIKTRGQFTGLLDKQGVEIYEGDIIYTSGYGNDIVVFKNGRFCIDGFEYPHNNINYNTAEVVGNIYENSDLLK